MNPRLQPASSRRARARYSLLLLLSLAACDPAETDAPPRKEAADFLRASFNGTVRSFAEHDFALRDEPPGLLVLCGLDDPDPRLADEEVMLCLRLQLDTAVLGTGPVTLPFDGTAQVPGGVQPTPTFTPAAGHDARVRAAWAWTGCYAPPPQAPTTQQVRGTLELTENSATRLAGRLVLTAQGTLAGPCAGESAEADLDFTVERG